MQSMTTSIDELYGEVWGVDNSGLVADLTRSLNPRNPALLYEMFESLRVKPGARVLDVGCRDASHAVELARKFGCRVIAIDPIPLHLEKAKKLVSNVGLASQVEVKAGRIEALPLGDASVDHIWCRDMLLHVDLPQSFTECFRVLRPAGRMLIYHVFATGLCEPVEAERLSKALSFVPESMSENYFETAAQEVGFEIMSKEILDSEWREAEIEVGDQSLLNHLLYLARMRRAKAILIEKYGEVRYEVNYAGWLLGVYQMLGKLCPTVYVLGKPSHNA
jgi:ubiquinone/menaquinone biosynthesis C-methylase UbiE